MGPDDLQVIPVTPEHVAELAAHMRPGDAAEVLASGGYSPLDAIEASIRVSQASMAVVMDGQLAAIFGVFDLPGQKDCALAWCLTSTVVDRKKMRFAIASQALLQYLFTRYTHIVNAIDARYEKALRWARWLGADVRPAIPFGLHGEPFHPVVFRRH